MDELIDYYEILGVPDTAEDSEIEAAVIEQRRLWYSRQNSPVVETQNEAKLRMKHIADAKSILLDPASRIEFDQQRQKYHATRNVGQTFADEGEAALVVRLTKLVELDDYDNASKLAQEAVAQYPASITLWLMRATAANALNDHELAQLAYDAALKLDDANVDVWMQKGLSLARAGKSVDAESALRAALARADASQEDEISIHLCRALRDRFHNEYQFDLLREAVDTISSVLERLPENQECQAVFSLLAAERPFLYATVVQAEMVTGDMLVAQNAYPQITSDAQVKQLEADIRQLENLAASADSIEGENPLKAASNYLSRVRDEATEVTTSDRRSTGCLVWSIPMFFALLFCYFIAITYLHWLVLVPFVAGLVILMRKWFRMPRWRATRISLLPIRNPLSRWLFNPPTPPATGPVQPPGATRSADDALAARSRVTARRYVRQKTYQQYAEELGGLRTEPRVVRWGIE